MYCPVLQQFKEQVQLEHNSQGALIHQVLTLQPPYEVAVPILSRSQGYTPVKLKRDFHTNLKINDKYFILRN